MCNFCFVFRKTKFSIYLILASIETAYTALSSCGQKVHHPLSLIKRQFVTSQSKYTCKRRTFLMTLMMQIDSCAYGLIVMNVSFHGN